MAKETMRKTNSPIYLSLPMFVQVLFIHHKNRIVNHFYLIEKRNKTGGGGDSKIGGKDVSAGSKRKFSCKEIGMKETSSCVGAFRLHFCASYFVF
jgi:hypothetical protein